MRDFAATRAAIECWLRARLQGASAVTLPDLKPAQGGSSSETIFLAPEIVEDGRLRREQWVLRIEATGFQVYQDPSVARQFEVMEAVARDSAAPVPRLLWLERDPAILGAPFFVMERVDGIVPSQAYHGAGLLFEAAPQDRRAMWRSAIQAMAAIHRIDTRHVNFLARPHLGATGLDQEIAAWDAYLEWGRIPDHPVLARTRRWLEEHKPASRTTGLAWGDARLGNMIFGDNACRAVLDWETASLGGAETDLGWWIHYDWWVTEGLGVARLDGIGDREETIAAWEEAAGRTAEAMDWHEMFATYRFAIISERAVALTIAAGGEIAIGGGDTNPSIVRLRQLLD